MDCKRLKFGFQAGCDGFCSVFCRLVFLLELLVFPVLLALHAAAITGHCAYEDNGLGARARGMGNSFTGISSDVSSLALNPGALGGIRKMETGVHFLRAFRNPAGDTDLTDVALAALYPSEVSGRLGTFGVAGRVGTLRNFSRDKQIQFGCGTWQLARTGWGVLDAGGSFKILQRKILNSGDSAMAVAMDMGAVLRRKSRYAFGLSVLNIGSPRLDLGGKKDKAPFIVRAGVSEQTEDYTLTLDLAQRSGSSGSGGGYTLSSGFEYWWKTYRRGVFGTRTGLSVGNHSDAWSLGVSYRHMGAELHYAAVLPLNRTFNTGHALSLAVRFGHHEMESEYERIIKQEMRYRGDLMEALGEARKRENSLREELENLRRELEELSSQLKKQALKADEALRIKESIERMVSRQKKAEAEIRDLETKKNADRFNRLVARYKSDWGSYINLKAGGTPPAVLKGSLQRILKEYQGTGVDLSQAAIELRNVIKAESSRTKD
ncbi:MAG: hypothetical protein ABIG11_01780 [bacterium]